MRRSVFSFLSLYFSFLSLCFNFLNLGSEATLGFLNLGSVSLRIKSYAITGDANDNFDFAFESVASFNPPAIISSGCPTTSCQAGELCITGDCVANSIAFGPGEFTPLQIIYAPMSTGTHTATVEIRSDDPDTPLVTIALQGTN